MITCPEKTCGEEIDTDSIFCDQCGIQLRICESGSCLTISLGKFCGKCGSKTTLKRQDQTSQSQPPSHPKVFDNPPKTTSGNAPQQNLKQTMMFQSKATGFAIKSDKHNITIEIGQEELIGRGCGNHSQTFNTLSNFVSATHGKFTRAETSLFYEDLGSSNGSFINGQQCEPNKPIELRLGDLVTFGDLEFIIVGNK